MLKGKQTYNQVMHTKDLQIAQVGHLDLPESSAACCSAGLAEPQLTPWPVHSKQALVV